MKRHLLNLSLIFAAFTAGCATKAPAPTPPAVPAALPVNTFMQKWSTQIDPSAGGVAQLYAIEDLIFAYTKNGSVYVIDRASGRTLHVDPIPGGLTSLHPPVLFKDRIVYLQLNAMQIFERKSGNFQRTARLPLAVRSNAVGTKSELFFGADFPGGGRLICLDMTRDFFPIRWGLMFSNVAVSAAPAVFGDVAFAAGEDGRVAAVAVDNREAAWGFGFFETAGPIYGDLQVDETGLYVASDDSKLYCINRASGKVKWQYFAGVGLKATPTVTKDLVLEFVPATGVVALDKAPPAVDNPKGPQYDRKPRWTASDATQFLAEDTKFLYLARNDQSIEALDKTTGNLAFASKESGFAAFAINTKDGIVFAATSDNRIIAVQPVPAAGTIGEIVRADIGDPRSIQLAQGSN